MSTIKDILENTAHRPFPLPEGSWKYYQDWHDVIFAHWKVPLNQLRKIVPAGLETDLLDGEAWVSLSAFTVKNLRPYLFPSFPPLSDFQEINLMTYVKKNNKPGIYFLSLEAHKKGSTVMARTATGLNYYYSNIIHQADYYESENPGHKFYLKVRYVPGQDITEKSRLDTWLIERYSLFHELPGGIYSNDIHHTQWPLKKVEIETFNLRYRFGDLLIDRKADLYHYSPGVQVLTWKKEKA